jgi:hypothetical protein
LCGFCRITDLGILLFNFSCKNYSYLEEVVDLITLSTTKFGLLFLDISMILNRFYKFQPIHSKRGRIFLRGEVGHGVAKKRWGTAIGLSRDRLMAVVRPGRSPASGGGGAEAARPQELGRR